VLSERPDTGLFLPADNEQAKAGVFPHLATPDEEKNDHGKRTHNTHRRSLENETKVESILNNLNTVKASHNDHYVKLLFLPCGFG